MFCLLQRICLIFAVGVDERAKKLPKFKGQFTFKKGIYRTRNTKKGVLRHITRPFTAKEWETIMQVSLYLFYGYVIH